MTRSTSLCLTTCVALAISIAYAQSTAVRGQQIAAAPDKERTVDFKDKIVLFEVNRSSALETKSGSVVLANVRVTKLGNRDFVVGDGYAPEENEDSWYRDMMVGVPCDNILRFHAMTPAQFKDYMKMWKDHSEE